MTKAETRDEARVELVRLLGGLDFYRAWRIAVLRSANPARSEEEIDNEVVVPGAFWLQLFDDAKGSQWQCALKEVRQWYSHTYDDLAQIARTSEAARGAVDQFLAEFRSALGFGMETESGFVRKVADRVLKRGLIASREEYDILRELEVDQSSTVLGDEERSELAALLQACETKAPPD